MDKSKIQRRVVAEPIQVRSNADGTIGIRGYAAVFDSPAHGEVIRRGAFNRTLAQRDDVRLLVNHAGVPLARTKAGTLTLGVDDHGEWFDAPSLDPDNPTVRELTSAMARGDIDQCSFSGYFETRKVNGVDEVVEVRQLDVSIVTFPWYEDTTAGLTGERDADRQLVSARSASAEGLSPEQRAAAVRALQRMAPPGKESWSDITSCVWDAIEESTGCWAYVHEIGDDWVVYRLWDGTEYEWGCLLQCSWSRDDAGVVTLGVPFEVVAEFNPAPTPTASESDAQDREDVAPVEVRTYSIAEARALLAPAAV